MDEYSTNELTAIGMTPEQDCRDSGLAYASRIVSRVAAVDAQQGHRPDWEELGDATLAMAQRFQRYVETGETEVTA